ncbi:retrovirus-related pol polyprotein from transposon TNT 1-94 [Tanacetum coccineum]
MIVQYEQILPLGNLALVAKKRRLFMHLRPQRESARDVYSKRRIIAVTKSWPVTLSNKPLSYSKSEEGFVSNLTEIHSLLSNISLELVDMKGGSQLQAFRSLNQLHRSEFIHNEDGILLEPTSNESHGRPTASRRVWSRFDTTYLMARIQRIRGFLEYGPRLISSIILTFHISNTAYWSSLDMAYRSCFLRGHSEITKDGKFIGRGIRKKGLYVMKLGNKSKDKICLETIDENSTLWHSRLGHANMRLIQSLASKELVRNLPKLKFDQHLCDACKIGKQAHASYKAKNIVSTTRCLELLHMDLFGPSAVRSYGGNRYTLVIVDDYYRYTWTRFLKDKTKAFDQFKISSKKIQNQLGCTIVSIRTDHDREFDNEVQFGEFCDANRITHNFSAPRTPQSNGMVERKNRTLQEMSRTMLNEQSLPQKFWCNAVDTSTYILNRILIRAILGKTPYELLRGRKPTLDYFRVFGSKCFILNTKDYLTKFDLKSHEGVFLGYSQNSKAYTILNKHTRKIKESLNVKFDETHPPSKTSPLVDDDLDE